MEKTEINRHSPLRETFSRKAVTLLLALYLFSLAEETEAHIVVPTGEELGRSHTPIALVAPPESETARLAPIVRRGSTQLPEYALTMDDGWSSSQVEKVLNICKQLGIKMTFFPVGKVIKANPALWKRAVEEGHELGNHTFSHAFLTGLSDERVRQEIEMWQQAVDQALGYHYPTKFFRPPGMAGFTTKDGDRRLREIIGKYGLSVALWSVDSGSTRYYGKINENEVFENVVKNSGRGAIVLQHFIPTDITALQKIIKTLEGRGLLSVTLSELTIP